jgi:hypothetical protein
MRNGRAGKPRKLRCRTPRAPEARTEISRWCQPPAHVQNVPPRRGRRKREPR